VAQNEPGAFLEREIIIGFLFDDRGLLSRNIHGSQETDKGRYVVDNQEGLFTSQNMVVV